MSTNITKFIAGVEYFYTSVVDSDYRGFLKIIKRTTSSVWIHKDGKLVRKKIYLSEKGIEYIHPWGIYSMCPSCYANNVR